ncbi:MAG: NAD-dependent epimerase/dehydratase family protein, partial [Clostridia bacterium]|nr:NAD-dependent epimerase/dehydratase family protein [Clostridia bacterium]
GSVNAMDETYCGYIDCNTSRAGYNEAKRVSESLCQSYMQQHGVDVVIGRLARIFGADRKSDTKAIAQFMRKAVDGEDIVLKSKGNQMFSFCYVADAISGLLKVLLEGQTGEVYNISADNEAKTLGEYAKLIAGFAGKNIIYDLQNDKGASKADYALLDCNKLKLIGWNPLYSVSEGLERTFNIQKAIQANGRI